MAHQNKSRAPEDLATTNARTLKILAILLLLGMPLVGLLHQQREAAARHQAAELAASRLAALPTMPDDALADLGADAGVTAGRKVGKPEGWQKRPVGSPPACGKKEREIQGACYRRAHPDDYSPPCEYPTAEYQGACYYAIKAEARPDNSIQR